MVGVRGFEPPTPSSRTMCATRLRYTPTSPLKAAGAVYSGAAFAAQASRQWSFRESGERTAPPCSFDRSKAKVNHSGATRSRIGGAKPRAAAGGGSP